MKSRLFAALLVGASTFAGPSYAQATRHATSPAAAPKEPSPVAVPSGKPAAEDSTRFYDSQALRFESRWGSADIKRGVDGTVVGRVGWFRGFDVAALVAASPRAVAEARRFHTENFRGSLVGSAGVVTFLTGIVVASNSSNNAASPILIIAGAGGIAWGAHHLQVGYSALSRAFWWYNRDLSR